MILCKKRERDIGLSLFLHPKRGASLKIIKKVPVKVVLTEKEREAQIKKWETRESDLEREVEQFHFERKKMEKKHGSLPSNIDDRLNKEIRKRKAEIEGIHYHMEQIQLLPEFYELTIDEVESVVEVLEGMKWQTVKEREIVIEDGHVKRVRDE
ncbi:hypothetical protein MJ3_02612 [Salimicrobium jeotgali]|uniref:YlqD protein n=1 Tax=Salimicrobium jeotgali TaxID=1230341 RepID=K2GR02_9BACI|nr:hypothetical protein MJ3_02612 [Salimicrobium jeotgali]